MSPKEQSAALLASSSMGAGWAALLRSSMQLAPREWIRWHRVSRPVEALVFISPSRMTFMSVERLQRVWWKRADPRWSFRVASVAGSGKTCLAFEVALWPLPACASFSVVRLRTSETCNVEGGSVAAFSCVRGWHRPFPYLFQPPVKPDACLTGCTWTILHGYSDIHSIMSCYVTSAARLLQSYIWWAMWREHPPPHSVPYPTSSISGQLQVATYRIVPA